MPMSPIVRRIARAKPPSKSGALAPKKAIARKPAAKVAKQLTPRVESRVIGGYRVYGSPVTPAHLTLEQIAKAVAAMK